MKINHRRNKAFQSQNSVQFKKVFEKAKNLTQHIFKISLSQILWEQDKTG